ALIAAVTLAAFHLVYAGDELRLGMARTAAFCVLALSQLFFSFVCRSQRYTLPELGIASNRYLFAAIAASLALQVGVVLVPGVQHAFNATGLSQSQWGMVFLLSLVPATVVETFKLLVNYAIRKQPNKAPR